MQRRAFLIGGNYKEPENLLAGVGADIAAWKSYLMSSCGGSWTDDEIVDMSGWDKNLITAALQVGRAVDYSLVCFSGHGHLAKDRFGFNVTMALIDDSIEMSERELNPGSPWTMMIFDCCRKSEETVKIALANESLNSKFLYDTREIFERELLKCEKGLVKVFAADVEESADDDRSFSRILMDVAKEQVGSCEDGVLRINEAVRLADSEMEPQYNPVYMGGRRLHHFPFAVSVNKIFL